MTVKSVAPLVKQVTAFFGKVSAEFPEIQSVHYRRVEDNLEVYVLAELDRQREEAFYTKESELLRTMAPGALLVHLLNMANFEKDAISVLPEGALPLELSLV